MPLMMKRFILIGNCYIILAAYILCTFLEQTFVLNERLFCSAASSRLLSIVQPNVFLDLEYFQLLNFLGLEISGH